MAVTAVDVANLALDNLGVTQKISALSDGTREGDAAGRWYTYARDNVLADINWRWARRFSVALTEITAETNAEWAHLYALPADCLEPRRIVSGLRSERTGERIPFDVMLNAAGTTKVLVTDLDNSGIGGSGVIIEYTAALTDPTAFSVSFVEALSWRLAVQLAPPLVRDAKVLQTAWAVYTRLLATAWRLEEQARVPDAEADSEFIAVRL